MQIEKSGLKNKKKILIVTQYFWPENFRINQLTKFFIKSNYDVTILTGQPNYPSGILYSEYKKDPKKFNIFYGAKVIRVPIILRKNSTKFDLFINYLSFNISSIIYSYCTLRKSKFDFVLTFATSPVTVALTSIFYKNLFKSKHIIWLLDLWPEIIFNLKLIKSGLIFYFLKKIINYIYRNSDLILVQSESFKKKIISELYYTDIEKIKILYSWSEFPFAPKKIFKNKKKFNIVFTGNLGEAQNFNLVLKVIKKIELEGIDFTIIGSGRMVELIKNEVKEKKIKNIYFVSQVSSDKIKEYLEFADAFLISLVNGSGFSKTIPGKFQNYISYGKPIIGFISGETEGIINNHNLGFASSSQNVKYLSDNVIKLKYLSNFQKEQIRNSSKVLYRDLFSQNVVFSKLKNYLNFLDKYRVLKTIKLILNPDISNFKGNFILSGLNLAFIGTLAQRKLFIHKNMYHWPDGLFKKRFFSSTVPKISGKKLLNQLIISKNIKKIYILGNASVKQIKYAKERFDRQIEHIPLAYKESVYEIYEQSKLINKNFKESDLIIITLPTPKQEYLANLISQKKNYKIICIGGALAMATGEEKSVPEKFENILGFEAIWRLKTDTIRRSKRLLFTLFFFVLGEISGFYKTIKGKIVVK